MKCTGCFYDAYLDETVQINNGGKKNSKSRVIKYKYAEIPKIALGMLICMKLWNVKLSVETENGLNGTGW